MREPSNGAWLFWSVLVVCLVRGCVVGLGSATACFCGGPREDYTRQHMEQLADTAREVMRRNHLACVTLDQIVAPTDIDRDYWGSKFVVTCPEPGHVRVRSLGEDALLGTLDDLWSADEVE